MVTVFPLASGSSGNSFYLSAGEGQGGLLIDAGISARRITTALSGRGIDPHSVRAMLVTHDHIDHIKGVRVLAKQLGFPIYGSEETLGSLSHVVEPGTRLIPIGAGLELASFGITPFATQHDAAGSLGFRLEAGERTIGFATDLGTVTETVWQHLLGSDLVVLESNYDERTLLNCGYPYPLKRRISSEHGHLSNREAAETLARLALRGTARFVLAHLSRESNTPELALETARERLSREELWEERDYRLTAARRDEPSEPIRF